MAFIDDQVRYPVLDHLRVTEKLLRLIEQLARGPHSCDYRLVGSYALHGLSRSQTARRNLTPARQA